MVRDIQIPQTTIFLELPERNQRYIFKFGGIQRRVKRGRIDPNFLRLIPAIITATIWANSNVRSVRHLSLDHQRDGSSEAPSHARLAEPHSCRHQGQRKLMGARPTNPQAERPVRRQPTSITVVLPCTNLPLWISMVSGEGSAPGPGSFVPGSSNTSPGSP